jgi:hypothetical protein
MDSGRRLAILLVAAVCAPAATVPFVGCFGEGQLASSAPQGSPTSLSISLSVAAKLAHYDDGQQQVLAPRGWNCYARFGSGGFTLYVSPQPIDPQKLFSAKWTGFSGPVVILDHIFGDTSGAWDVAKVIAHVFPKHLEFTRKVMAGNYLPASEFPTGPYPADRLKYKSAEMVEFETPAGADGLGTIDDPKNSMAVRGAAQLIGDETPDLLLLTVRLPPELGDLAPVIIQQFERSFARSH